MQQVCSSCRHGSRWRVIAQLSYVTRVIDIYNNHLRTFATNNGGKILEPFNASDGNTRGHSKPLPVHWGRSINDEGVWWRPVVSSGVGSIGTLTQPSWRFKSTDCSVGNGGLYNMPVPQLRIVSTSISSHVIYNLTLTHLLSVFHSYLSEDKI